MDKDQTNGAPLYEWICKQGDCLAAVRACDAATLGTLHSYLLTLPSTGIPQLVLGLVRDEAATRYLSPQ